MPEYLTPGVYVEETSFRSKSIEGVSTSTTAFAGPTRKGPVGETPELVTSFGDFQRIYGGLERLSLGASPVENYVAHAVRSYFDNGGVRLYVARTYEAPSDLDAGLASSAPLANGARFVARFPGETGNGRVVFSFFEAPATARSMETAPTGSLLRTGGTPVRAAAVLGSIAGPYAVPNDGVLLVTVGGTEGTITFHGERVALVSPDALADPVALGAGPATLQVVVDGAAQSIALGSGDVPRADLVDLVNRTMTGGYARLTVAADPEGPDHLVIGGDRAGRSAQVSVTANAALGFPADAEALGTANAANTVNDLARVTTAEIAALAPAGLTVTAGPAGLVLTTLAGAPPSVEVRTGAGSVHAALGLPPGVQGGTAGSAVNHWIKTATGWLDGAATAFAADLVVGRDWLLTLTILATDADGNTKIYEDLGVDPAHPRFFGLVLPKTPKRKADALENLFAFETTPGTPVTGHGLLAGILALQLAVADRGDRLLTLSNGSDGLFPGSTAYEAAFEQLQKLDDISIVAAPASAADETQHEAIVQTLLIHVEKARSYRVAVIDTLPDQSIGEARQAKSKIDSKYGALYYPWVVVANPLWRPGDARVPREIALPPSGSVCGIYARNDVERGVFKAPANEIVRGALRFESDINFAEQGVLNPIGVNCLRFFPGRGYRVWGARTTSSDPEWKYVSVRRYFNYIERSIDVGTQWAVFEPNGERLWENIRETISSFLYSEWRSGALLGADEKQAFFVHCDRSTMDQNDLDNGRLVCLVGVAVVKPAEFVIFRIGQKTADARS